MGCGWERITARTINVGVLTFYHALHFGLQRQVGMYPTDVKQILGKLNTGNNGMF